MDDDEVNRVIAEYMGKAGMEKHHINGQYKQTPFGPRMEYDIEERSIEYTKSLDALVPVWEKLDEDKTTTFDGILLEYCISGPSDACFINIGYEVDYLHYSDPCQTIQQAAAHATAKAIEELK